MSGIVKNKLQGNHGESTAGFSRNAVQDKDIKKSRKIRAEEKFESKE